MALTIASPSVIGPVTGTGSVVLSVSPTLVTPVLGTPTSGNLANCTFPTLNQSTTGIAANVSGVVAAVNGGTGLAAPGVSGNILRSNGTAWTSAAPVDKSGFTTVVAFTTSQAWAVPAGITVAKVTIVGAGGNGGATGGQGSATGGGGGGVCFGYATGLSGSISITVGAGSSQTSSFGTLFSATGGSAGVYPSSTSVNGGIGIGGYLNLRGERNTAGIGGSSAMLFGSGGAAGVNGVGAAGVLYGGGGGGGATSAFTSMPGGAGAAGIVIVEY